jgi:hypothetical protein
MAGPAGCSEAIRAVEYGAESTAFRTVMTQRRILSQNHLSSRGRRKMKFGRPVLALLCKPSKDSGLLFWERILRILHKRQIVGLAN